MWLLASKNMSLNFTKMWAVTEQNKLVSCLQLGHLRLLNKPIIYDSSVNYMEKYTMFVDWKNQYSENEYTTQSNL